MAQPKFFADSNRPQLTTVDLTDILGVSTALDSLGAFSNISVGEFVAQFKIMRDWAAGDYLTGQRVQFHNLQLEALDSFTSANVLTELAAATPKWKVVGGNFSKNVIAASETYVVPKNFTCIATRMVVTGTVEVMDNAYLRVYGELTGNENINKTGTGTVQLKPL